MKKFITVIMAIAFALSLAACAPQQTDDTIGIRGEVTSITTEKGFVSMLVEGEIEEDTAYDKASVKVNADTKVVKVQGGEETDADMQGIKLFDIVEVVFEGPVAESYPVQGTAKKVRILVD